MPLDPQKICQVSVKGLCYNDAGAILMVLDNDNEWEIVGGRVEKGEDLIDCLKRECQEEMGIPCEILDPRPAITYSCLDQDGEQRIMIYFNISLPHLNFTPSDECRAINFYSPDEIRSLKTCPQITKLPDYL